MSTWACVKSGVVHPCCQRGNQKRYERDKNLQHGKHRTKFNGRQQFGNSGPCDDRHNPTKDIDYGRELYTQGAVEYYFVLLANLNCVKS